MSPSISKPEAVQRCDDDKINYSFDCYFDKFQGLTTCKVHTKESKANVKWGGNVWVWLARVPTWEEYIPPC